MLFRKVPLREVNRKLELRTPAQIECNVRRFWVRIPAGALISLYSWLTHISIEFFSFLPKTLVHMVQLMDFRNEKRAFEIR